MPLRKPKGAARAARPLRDAGQTTVEYVVVIAIIIGLGAALTAFAATEKGSIADAANSVGNMFSQLSGPAGSGSGGGDEGAGGSGGAGATGGSGAGAGSEIDTLAQKDPHDWTLDDQKAVAKDIAAKGEASAVYAKAEAAMDAGTKWSVKLTNGKTLEYRIIGIDHDGLADGSGGTGLTFEATNNALDAQRMCTTDNYSNSWEESELRARLNTGDLWALLPSELQSKVETVAKETNAEDGEPLDATDKVFLLSTTEVYGDLDSEERPEGFQYEYFQSKGVTMSSYSGASSDNWHWTRSARRGNTSYFYYVNSNGSCWSDGNVGYPLYVFPAWCF